MIKELNERSQAILKYIVDSYMETGVPVGSRVISDTLDLNLSPASIRSIMADLESAGLLHAPHTSAGRLPTQQGLRLYIDGLMEIGDLSPDERQQIELQCRSGGQSMEQLYQTASTMLSGLSSAAGLVIAPKTDNKPLRQIQFVRLDENRVLVVLVMQDGLVENRVMEVSGDIPPSSLTAAANYLNEKLAGKTIAAAQDEIAAEMQARQTTLDAITADLVARGIALAPRSGGNAVEGHLIVRGQSKLLNDVRALEDLERARQLLAALEEQQTIAKLLEQTQNAQGIEIFIGTENRVFSHSGWSMIISPYKTAENKIIGAIGVIGPTRLNYSRIIPIVDYTTKVMEKIVGTR